MGRRQRMGLNGRMSRWELVKTGIPQGSVLGSLLFSIFVDDLTMEELFQVLKFADNTKIFSIIETQSDQVAMQARIDRVMNWARLKGQGTSTMPRLKSWDLEVHFRQAMIS